MARRDGDRYKLSDFHRYLEERYREARRCEQVVEGVRERMADAFRRELDAWQKTFDVCYPELAQRRRELPAPFVQHIDRTEEEELARLRAEIERLTEEVEAGRTRSDELLEAAQAQTDALRRAHPELNRREEELKAEMIRYQDEYAQAFEAAERAGEGALAWLTRFGTLQRLRGQQRQAKRKQEETLAQLRQVREDWLNRVKEAGETQAELRKEWQEVGVRVAEAQTKRDHLDENLPTLAEQNALQRVLEELSDPPGLDGEFGDAMRDLARRNAVRARYEEGLEVSAEFLGRTKGMADGLEKFGSSVANVVREQRRYNLRQVQVHVPSYAARSLATWAEVLAHVRDPSRYAERPEELTAILQPYIRDRMSDVQIRQMFEGLGEELNRATAAWG